MIICLQKLPCTNAIHQALYISSGAFEEFNNNNKMII